ncbi:MAG: MmcQ/YjbR family DNA-binding protein [Acidimicrobiia bacterium]|nr:MmcQ/YjbR family DNA-binding protein [Acidimicrobiia bacterium]
MTPEEVLGRLRSLCSLLPEVKEVDLLGEPAFRVATNTFAAFEVLDDGHAVTFKLTLDEQATVVEGERFVEASERGEHGWTSARIDRTIDWEHLDELVVASYRLVAPDWCVARLDALLAGEPPPAEA